MDPESIDEYQVARLLAASRLLIGGLLLAAPGVPTRVWLGKGRAHREVKMMARAAGAREVVLAVGALKSLTEGSGARPWVAGAATADALDALIALVFLGRRQPGRAVLVAALAGGAALAGAGAARQLAEPGDTASH
jgi:hypothetical protein